nr:hypothetical protein [Tanacetum cinerariifolium]
MSGPLDRFARPSKMFFRGREREGFGKIFARFIGNTSTLPEALRGRQAMMKNQTEENEGLILKILRMRGEQGSVH